MSVLLLVSVCGVLAAADLESEPVDGARTQALDAVLPFAAGADLQAAPAAADVPVPWHLPQRSNGRRYRKAPHGHGGEDHREETSRTGA
jgi:hypothetical protein